MKKSYKTNKQQQKISKSNQKGSQRNSESAKNPSVYIAVTLIISITIILFTFVFPYQQSLFPVNGPTAQSTAQIELLQREVESLKEQVEGLSKGLNLSPNDVLLNAKIDLIDKRLISIENSLSLDPGKAVELTIVHKDVEQLGKDLEAIREEMKRNFGLFQFFLGTIALTFFTFVVNNLFVGLRNNLNKSK